MLEEGVLLRGFSRYAAPTIKRKKKPLKWAPFMGRGNPPVLDPAPFVRGPPPPFPWPGGLEKRSGLSRVLREALFSQLITAFAVRQDRLR